MGDWTQEEVEALVSRFNHREGRLKDKITALVGDLQVSQQVVLRLEKDHAGYQYQIAERDAEIERLNALLLASPGPAQDPREPDDLGQWRDRFLSCPCCGSQTECFHSCVVADAIEKLQAHEKREAALQMQIARLEQSVSAMSSDYHRAFNENMAYLAFVEAYDEAEEERSFYDKTPKFLEQAREQLRSVIDAATT